MEKATTNLLVIGGNLSGLSLAIQAQEAGVKRIMIIESGTQVVAPEVIGQHALSVEYLSRVNSISTSVGRSVLVRTERQAIAADVVAVAARPVRPSRPLDYPIPPGIADRVHLIPPTIDFRDSDVLVVGTDEEAAEYAWQLSGQGAGVVLAFGGVKLGTLSRLARRYLLRLEAERRATVLWRVQPEVVEDVAGFPMVYFGDRRTPDLQFDHVVFRHPGPSTEIAIDASGLESEVGAKRVYLLDQGVATDSMPARVKAVSPGQAWEVIRSDHFPHLPALSDGPRVWRPGDRDQLEELRGLFYNATIAQFERSHSDLWVLKVIPDHGDTHHVAGQYASLGLGYWEPRADGARDPGLERSWDKLIRRSYSISSPLLESNGYLFDPCRSPDMEFYVVLVPPTANRVPALTPRLALKRPGDRIYLGPKVTGRYTLSRLDDPFRRIVFLATGTGEAPHNSMIVELLRRGHRGPIVSVVSVRQSSDLGYLNQHLELEERFENYHYLPLVTRNPDVPKLYVQDVIDNGILEDRLGTTLDPTQTDVFMCGNPAMIGLPEVQPNGESKYPIPIGACQLLVDRGFVMDRRRIFGNLHYEEYW